MTAALNTQVTKTSSEWVTDNPILGKDIIGVEITPGNTLRYKRGDGITTWDGLNYIDIAGDYITAETDPTVPAWAKKTSKPTYTASEVGAAPLSHANDADIHVSTAEKSNWNAKLPSTLPPGSGVTFQTSGTSNGRLFTLQEVPDWVGWTLNAQFTSNGWVLDDPTKYGWFLKLDSRSIMTEYSVYLIPTGAGAHTDEYAVFTVKADGTCTVNGENVVLASDIASLQSHIKNGDIHVTVTDKTNWNNKANSDHVHSASDITTGILSVPRGGSGKSSWTANRILYPSSPTVFEQLPFPTVNGSFLRQGTSGAPYWTSPDDVRGVIRSVLRYARTSNQSMTSSSATKISLTSRTEIDDSGILAVSSNGIKVSKTGYYNISAQIIFSATGTAHQATLAINDGTNHIIKEVRTTNSSGSITDSVSLSPTLVYLTANTTIYLYYAGSSGDIVRGTTTITGTKYGTFLQLEFVG